MKLPVPQRLLIVCTANQCRSPAAEHLLRPKLAAAGLAVEVTSAGVWAEEGIPPLPLTVQAMAELGLDLKDHRSRRVSKELVDAHDVILAMTVHQLEELQLSQPFAARRMYQFRPFCQGRLWQAADPVEDLDIDDPVGLPLDAHQACVALLDALLVRLVEQWQQQAVPRG